MVDYVITPSAYIEAFFLRSFVWLINNSHFYLEESQKFVNRHNSALVPWQVPPYLSNNSPKRSSIGVLFALYANSFMRSFASCIRMMGSSLAISHNCTNQYLAHITPLIKLASCMDLLWHHFEIWTNWFRTVAEPEEDNYCFPCMSTRN